MNLYRSFGCLLETWVADGYPVERSSSAIEGLGKTLDVNGSDSASADSLRLTGAPLRSESEDSGVELPSMVSPLTSQRRVLTSQISQLEDDLRPSSSSPALSHCSSSSSSFSAVLKGSLKPSETAGLKVEEALRRTEPAWRRTVDGGLRRRCNTTSISNGSIRPFPIRSRVGSIGPGRPYVQPADEKRSSETPGVTHTARQPGISATETDGQAACPTGPEWDHLPPGFLYLEQMCRMLEEIARLQKENQKLHLEMKTSRDDTRETKMKVVCPQKADINSTVSNKPDIQAAEDQPDFPSFRRRSVSDTWTFLRQRSKSKALRAEHFTSTEVLLEEPENPQPPREKPVETEQRKASNSLKQKISSLRWNEKSKAAKSSSSSNEKKRTFGQFFKSRRKTTRF